MNQSQAKLKMADDIRQLHTKLVEMRKRLEKGLPVEYLYFDWGKVAEYGVNWCEIINKGVENDQPLGEKKDAQV